MYRDQQEVASFSQYVVKLLSLRGTGVLYCRSVEADCDDFSVLKQLRTLYRGPSAGSGNAHTYTHTGTYNNTHFSAFKINQRYNCVSDFISSVIKVELLPTNRKLE